MNLTRAQSVKGIVQSLPGLLDKPAGARVVEENMVRTALSYLDRVERTRATLAEIERRFTESLDHDEAPGILGPLDDAKSQLREGRLALNKAIAAIDGVAARFVTQDSGVTAYLRKIATELPQEANYLHAQMASIRALVRVKRD